MIMGRAATVALGLAIGVIASGCSSFNREWKAAARNPPAAGSVEGRWEGTWRSDANGHNGRLRCVLTRSGEDKWRAAFHAKFMKIFSYSHVTTLTGRETNGAVELRGEAKLSKLAGGLYKYEGRVTPTEFRSTYKSKRDHGTYQMTRPEK